MRQRIPPAEPEKGLSVLQSKLTLGNLKDLDNGIVDVAFQKAIAEVVADVQDRPGLAVDRVVSVVFRIRPTVNKSQGSHDGDRPKFTASVQYTVPKKVSEEYTAVVGKDGALMFRHDEPTNPLDSKLFDPDTGEMTGGNDTH